eukprot:6087218-Prymnesium_polylepis.1
MLPQDGGWRLRSAAPRTSACVANRKSAHTARTLSGQPANRRRFENGVAMRGSRIESTHRKVTADRVERDALDVAVPRD